jgi:hypothetical protein
MLHIFSYIAAINVHLFISLLLLIFFRWLKNTNTVMKIFYLNYFLSERITLRLDKYTRFLWFSFRLKWIVKNRWGCCNFFHLIFFMLVFLQDVWCGSRAVQTATRWARQGGEEKTSHTVHSLKRKLNFPHIYKEIQMGSGAKSYMRKGFPIYEEAVSHVWLCIRSHLDFLIYEKKFLFFFISVLVHTWITNLFFVVHFSIFLKGYFGEGARFGSWLGLRFQTFWIFIYYWRNEAIWFSINRRKYT